MDRMVKVKLYDDKELIVIAHDIANIGLLTRSRTL